MFERLLCFIVCSISFSLSSQIGMHDWRLFVTPTKAISVASGDGRVIAALENGLIEYDIQANEKTVWTKVNYLSDIFVSTISFDAYTNSFWIGYTNGNIDKLQNASVTNLSALKNSNIMGNKKIIKFISKGNFIYALTEFGVLKIDPKSVEVRDTYYPTSSNSKWIDFEILGDSIFVISESSMYQADLKNNLLANPANWSLNNNVSLVGQSKLNKLCVYNSSMYIASDGPAYKDDSLYLYTNNGLFAIKEGSFVEPREIINIQSDANYFYLILYDGIHILDTSLHLKESIFRYNSGVLLETRAITNSNNRFWIADNNAGLVNWSDNWNNSSISFNGPYKNNFFSMDWKNGKLAVAGGVLDRTNFAFSSVGFYTMEDEVWSSFDRWNQNLWKDSNVWDVSSVSINPKNSNQVAVASYSEIPLSIQQGTQIKDVYTSSNSPLEKTSFGNGWSCVSDVEYDTKGNLWMLNAFTNQPLKVLSKDGLWYTMNTPSSVKNSYTRKLVIDSKGNKWIATPSLGVVGYKDNGTISDLSDDVSKIISDGLTTGTLPSKEVNAIAIDLEDELWIGTDNGFCILYNAPSILSNDVTSYNTYRVKLNYEGNVEYMLGNTSITDIEVDGGNRKWIATANAGLFLLSADGSEILESFTKDNSPLISNNILDLEINQETGEVFIITDIGLVSYRSDASVSDPTYSSCIVFPNPYKISNQGGITIQGIQYDSDVKITDSSGKLVYKTTSNGGTAFWNGKTQDGERVASGVYFFWTATNEGTGNKVGKVVVIN
jgi:hypothetical protein